MTKWWWLLDSGNCWESRLIVVSEAIPGVSFAIARMTFGRRLELMKRVRDLAARIEYFDAGRDEKNRMEASLLGAEMDKVYLAWGLEEVRGLVLDGEAATVSALIDRGPEALVHEALAAIKAECGLTETERKN
jgi:poly-gamma-glutamate capsule biosynthesis protein CapA/YwtB (metallophosphatase superfamily)